MVNSMKLLTMNTHSLLEADYEHKLSAFIHFLLHERPDVIALQEVNQTLSASPAEYAQRIGFIPPPDSAAPLKQDNHALRIAAALYEAGVPCSWTYLPVKIGYGRYDEGLALLSLSGQISSVDACPVSLSRDYRNWRTRMALGIQTENCSEWFYSVHMGWWQDETDPFHLQWRNLSRHLDPLRSNRCVWLLGDFNAPAEIRHQSYDLIASSGWQDSYLLAERKDGGITIPGAIDGWRGPDEFRHDMRIDQIWCSRPVPVLNYRTVFSGQSEPVISDHFGILIESGGIQ